MDLSAVTKTGSDQDRYAAMLRALSRPQAYPHPATAVEHWQTHISDVLLAGDYAYKLKKPVKLPFLDFSSLRRRLAACRNELRLNARLAPEIYLDVVKVAAAGNDYWIDSQDRRPLGRVVDYAVRMRRLPQAGMLHRVAQAGRLTPAHVVQIARRLVGFHARAGRGAGVNRHGGFAAVARRVRANLAEIAAYVGGGLTARQFERLQHYTEWFLREQAGLLTARVREGRVVDGHGDLHLKNICLVEDRIVIFDCVEFNPGFRCGDVIGDIAFLTMDLDAAGLPGLSNRFLNEYLELTGDYPGLALLDFYQIYRACVRGKVAALSAAGAVDAADSAPQMWDQARGYFHLAARYLTQGPVGMLITCGVSGSGKTTAARRAAQALNGIVVRSDAVRKHLAGAAGLPGRGAGYAQGIYHPRMTDLTYEALLTHARQVIAAGRWVILDATYAEAGRRRAAADVAHTLNVPFGIIHCTAPYAELERRLAQRRARADDLSDADRTVLQEQLRRFQAPSADEGTVLSGNDEDFLHRVCLLGKL